MRLLLRAGLLATVLLPVAVASAQTREQIREQDEQLYEQQQQQLQQGGIPTAPPIGGGDETPPSYPTAGSGGAGGASLTAQLLDRVSRLEDQVRTLRGRVDELSNEVQTQTAQLNKQIGDMNFAMQQGRGAAPPSAAAPQTPGYAAARGAAPTYAAPVAAPPPTAIHHTPEMALRDANIALARHDYQTAADLAREAAGGTHAAQAQYVLGEALTGQGNHGGAAAAFYTAYGKQPRGPLAGDALLHVGASLIATGDTNAACEALAQLRAGVPNARPGTLKAANVLRARAHCH